MKSRIHCASRCVAIFIMLFAITFLLALLVEPAGHHWPLVKFAAYAAGVSVTALLLDIGIHLISGRQLFPSMLLQTDPSDALMPEDWSVWDEINHRRKILELRLQIDKPRICSKRGFACTCWSFCGGDPDFNSGCLLDNESCQSPDDDEVQLATIDRSKVTDCPFP